MGRIHLTCCQQLHEHTQRLALHGDTFFFSQELPESIAHRRARLHNRHISGSGGKGFAVLFRHRRMPTNTGVLREFLSCGTRSLAQG